MSSFDENASVLLLIRNLQAETPEAAETLLRRYQPALLRIIRRYLGRRLRTIADTEDFSQAVWKSILAHGERLSQLQSDEAVLAYLTRVAAHKVASAARQEGAKKRDVGRRQPLDSEILDQTRGGDPTPSQLAMAGETRERLLSGLTGEHRRMIELRLEGHTLDEIALTLGVNERTVRRVVDRLVAKRGTE